MARPRASSTKAANSTAKVVPVKGRDRTIDVHNAWLNYLKPVSLGLVFSPNALRVAQVELPWQVTEDQQRFAAALHFDPSGGADIDPDQTPTLDPAVLLGWRPDLLEWYAARTLSQRDFMGGWYE